MYQVAIDSSAWTIWREAPGFSLRFKGTFAAEDSRIAGLWQLNEHGNRWNDDLRIDYRLA